MIMNRADVELTKERFGYDPTNFTHGSRKIAVFKCEFCFSTFEAKIGGSGRATSIACSKCRSISASYTISKSVQDKHSFYLERRPPMHASINVELTKERFGYSPFDFGSRSEKMVIATCEFCLQEITARLLNINNGSITVACRKCDSVASHYVKLMNESKSPGDKHEFWKAKQLAFNHDNMCVDETIAKFGYSPLELNQFTTKKIVALCRYCNDKVTIRMSKYSQRLGNTSCPKCVRKKTIKTLETKYGVTNTLDIPSVRAKLMNPKTEQVIESILSSRYRVNFIRNYIIGPYSFDFFVPSANLLIECQGDFFHNFKKCGYAGLPKDRSKSSYVETNTNHKLVWIWEHEIHIGRVNHILDSHILRVTDSDLTIDTNKLIFKTVTDKDAHSFLSQYHFLGNVGMVSACVGAYYNDDLVSVCVFGGVTRQNTILKVNNFSKTNFGPKQLRELRRFCIKPNIHADDLVGFCLNKFIDLLTKLSPSTKAVVSFSNPSIDDTESMYESLGWTRLSDSAKSYHYLDTVNNKQIHRRVVAGLANDSHMTERQFVDNSKLVKVDESPKHTWLRIL
jgi:hypothetical protein